MSTVDGAEVGAWPEDLDVRVYADTSLTLPGQSERPANCGEWGPRRFCDECGNVELGPQNCHLRRCPQCWSAWRATRSVAVTERLAAARRSAEGREKRLTHAVASPPEGEVRTLVDWEKAKREAYALAQDKGVRGGVLIPHGWRVKAEVKETWRELAEAGVVEGGLWRWVREHDRDWRSLTYWSPHFHVLGVGADLAASDPDGDDGWVWSRIDSFPRFEMTEKRGYEAMYRAASYLLSHVGFEPEAGKQCVRWFGSLAYNQFSPEQALEEWERSVIERNAQAVAEGAPVRREGDESGGASERSECEADGCPGHLRSIYEAGAFLSDPTWCADLDRSDERELATMFEWAIGDLHPPPGLKHPRSREEADEVREHLMSARSRYG